MGIRILHGGTITDYQPNNPGSAGQMRLNIRTGTGANDVVKYGLTSDMSASQYCKLSFKVSGSALRLGTSGGSTRASYYTVSESRYTATYDNGRYVYTYTGSKTTTPLYTYTGSQTTSPIYSYNASDTIARTSYTNTSYTARSIRTTTSGKYQAYWSRRRNATNGLGLYWGVSVAAAATANTGFLKVEPTWSGANALVTMPTASGGYTAAGSTNQFPTGTYSGSALGPMNSRPESNNEPYGFVANSTGAYVTYVKSINYWTGVGVYQAATVYWRTSTSTYGTSSVANNISGRVNYPNYYRSSGNINMTEHLSYMTSTNPSATAYQTASGVVGTGVANYATCFASASTRRISTTASMSRTTGASSNTTRNQAGTTITRSYSSLSRTTGATSNATRSQAGSTITRLYSSSWQSSLGYRYYTNQVPSNIWSSSVYTYQSSRQSGLVTHNFNV